MTQYLTTEQLIAINAAQEGGGGVADHEGVARNAHRPQSGFGDHETFPDLWSKAAAYVHGIASTQYFLDGNKRTAWLAANIFLDENGIELPLVPDIEAEMFVQSVAQKIFDTSDDPEATITKATEWLRAKYESTNALGRNERLDWAALGMAFQQHEDFPGIMNAEMMGIASAAVEGVPATLELNLAARCHFLPVDRGVPQKFDVNVEYAVREVAVIDEYTFPQNVGVPPPSGFDHHPYGLMPVLITGGVRLTILAAGTLRLVVTLNGKLLTKLPLSVQVIPGLEPGHNFDAIPEWLPGGST